MKNPSTQFPRPRRRLQPLGRDGLSLTELLVAVVVLAIGLLAMAGGTGMMIRMVDHAQLDTERSAALQSAVERVRATPFDDVAAGSLEQGPFTVSWTIQSSTIHTRDIRFQVTGPGRGAGGSSTMPAISRTATTTFDYRILRP